MSGLSNVGLVHGYDPRVGKKPFFSRKALPGMAGFSRFYPGNTGFRRFGEQIDYFRRFLSVCVSVAV